MILKKITLKAFSTYRDEQTADLSRYLGKVFLITGDTGAGKTTIFDGIIYALYGNTSGSVRDVRTLRCQSAPPDADSYAELLFSVDGTDYTVHRAVSAAGKVPKKDDCYIKWNAKDGSRCINGKTSVNEFIENLLGFDADAFCRISMLAQGEFSKFLNMKSGERGDVLRKVFGTQKYEKFEKLLKRRVDECRKERASITDRYDEILRQPVYAELDDSIKTIDAAEALEKAFDEKNNSLKAEIKSGEEQQEQLSEEVNAAARRVEQAKSLNERFDAMDNAEKALKALEQLGGEINAKKLRLARREAAAKVKPFADKASEEERELEKAKRRLAEAEQELETAVQALEKAEEESKNKDSLSKEKEELLSQKPLLEALPKLFEDRAMHESAVTKHSEAIRRCSEKLEQNKKDAERVSGDIEKLTKSIDETTAPAVKASELGKDLEAAETDKQNCEKLIKKISELQKANAEYISRTRESEEALSRYEEENNRFKLLEMNYHANIAGILAKQLGVGSKCPVCGSTEHPCPAELPENAPTAEAKDALEQSVASLDKKSQAAKEAKIKAEEKRNSAENAVREEYCRVFGSEPNDELLSEKVQSAAEERLENTKQRVKELAEQLAEAKAAEEALPQLKSERDKLKAENKALSEQEKALGEEKNEEAKQSAAEEATLSTVRKSIEENRAKLELPKGWDKPDSAAAAEKLLPDCAARIAEIERRIPELDKQLTAAREAKTTAEAMKNNAKTALNNQNSKYDNARAALEQAVSDEHFGSAEEAAAAYITEEEKIRLNSEIEEYSDNLSKAKGSLESIRKELSDKERADTEALEQAGAELSKRLSELTLGLGAQREKLNRLDNDRKSLKEKADEYSAKNGEYVRLAELNSLVAGSNDKSVKTSVAKLSLERYVQGEMFDEVLKRANSRLSELSGGRYLFLRNKTNSDSRKNSGLDIDVIDMNAGNNKTRDVSTLSGGESFLASFALAIGLSDYTMEVNGGRSTDILFVDEGFSSLDENTFEQAMDVINSVSTENRMVGIVSHVREIREHFSEEIYVSKGDGGSRIIQKGAAIGGENSEALPEG